jgi:hypothetical protein
LEICCPVDTASDNLQASALQSATEEANLLAVCNLDVTALNKANRIQEAITQVKSGKVQVIRDKYCPKLCKEPSNLVS